MKSNYKISLTVLMFIFSALTSKIWAGDNIWTYSSTGMNGGSIRRIAISPDFKNDHTLFVAAGTKDTFDPLYSCGIFKSSNGGESWIWVYDRIPVPIEEMAISPNYVEDKTVFAITNYSHGSSAGVLLKTNNGGIDWKVIDLSLENTGTNDFGTLSAISISPSFNNDQTIFVGDWIGNIFKSTNAGESFHTVRPTSLRIHSFAISPTFQNDSTIYASTGDVLKSIDGGELWVPVLTGFIRTGTTDLAISPSYANDSTVFVGTWDYGIYKTEDAGKTWFPVNDGLDYGPDIGDGHIKRLIISPTFSVDHTIFAITNGRRIYVSTNGGNSWENFSPFQNAIAESHLFQDYSNLNIRKFNDESNNNIKSYYQWNSDNSQMLLRKDIKSNHEVWETYDIALSPHFNVDATIYAATSMGVYRSNDFGVTWQCKMDGITAVVASDLESSPDFKEDSTVFVGTWQGLFKSTNGGKSWVLIGFKNSKVIIELSPDFTTDQIIFALVGDSLYKSHNSGSSWNLVSTGVIGDIVISPNYPDDLTLFSYFEEIGVHKSIDDGKTWQEMNNGLNDLGVSALALSPNFANDQTVIIGTFFSGDSGGVFKSENGGESWFKLDVATGFNPMIGDIAFSPAYAQDSTIFVSQSFLSNFLHKSTDGGKTWITVNNYISANNIALSPDYENDQTIFLGSGKGEGVLVSENGGETWRDFNSGFTTDYAAANDLIVVDTSPLTIFTAGSGGVWQYTMSLILEELAEIDVGFSCSPAVADIDNDKDMDIFIGNSIGDLYYYQNVGNSSNPNYILQSKSRYGSHPTFVDIDNDGDLDLFVGISFFSFSGKINFYRNTGSSSQPDFSLESNYFSKIDVGDDSAPSFSDIDGDGDFDLFVGEKDGNINFFRNIGTADSAVFELITENYTNINFEDPWWKLPKESTPYFADIDNDGDDDLFVGDFNGKIKFYRNIGSKTDPYFILETEEYASLDFGYESSPAIVDIDFDGDLDLLVGNGDGNILFYRNISSMPTNVKDKRFSELPQSYILEQNYPNPFNPITTIKYQSPKNTQVTINVYNVLGQLVRRLVDKEQPAGYYSIQWDGKDDMGQNVGSGVYVYRIQAGDFQKAKKMLLIR